MNLLEEKKELMKLIVELTNERKAIISLYEAIEKRLNQTDIIENTISEGESYTKATIIPKKEIVCAKFNDQKIKPSSIPYNIISKDICYVLKTSDIPMTASQIYSVITKDLVNNILPKMVDDNNLPIEKVHRVFCSIDIRKNHVDKGGSSYGQHPK
ncbi:hypothetical protein ABE871_01950 [Enterococcus gilvus]|uniref:hypothetical protein n=1 Tax=Enterococcus gilvus TaxID=160453 RepID=UPI003D6AEEC3